MISSVLNKPIALPQPRYILQDQLATLNEYCVGVALELEQIEYDFRVSFFGGKALRGGIEIDFLIYTPFTVAVEVYGNYWHSGQLGAGDILRNKIIAQELGSAPVIIWGTESQTVLDARNALRKKLRL